MATCKRSSWILLLATVFALFDLGNLTEMKTASDNAPPSSPPVQDLVIGGDNGKSSTKDSKLTNFKTENRKKELNKASSTSSTFVPPDSGLALYRLNVEGGGTCILFMVDALVSFNFITKLNEKQEVDTYVPSTPTISGDCSDEDLQTLVLKWKSFVLIMTFSKTPGGERWFVEKIDLKYDSSDSFFAHIKNPGRTYTLSTVSGHGQLLFPTPVGKSYRCENDVEIMLTNPKQTDTTAKLILRDFKLEPFIFKNDEFGPEYICSAGGAGSYRSETAPLIVGSTLAAACLLTVAGYAVFRYFKIKKVQYDTME